MNDIESQIAELKKKQFELEQSKSVEVLKAKYEKLKKLEGTVEIKVNKTNKRTRHVHIIHHISFNLCTSGDTTTNENKPYISIHNKVISVTENPLTNYKTYEIISKENRPGSYNSKMYETDYYFGYLNWETNKTISLEQFKAIEDLVKISSHNILDGLLEIQDIPWVLNGSDNEFSDKERIVKGISKIDIPHVILTTEESSLLDSSITNLFRNKNIYFITPNSLQALIEFEAYKDRWNTYAYNASSSIGVTWQGSRKKDYQILIDRIKKAANEQEH